MKNSSANYKKAVILTGKMTSSMTSIEYHLRWFTSFICFQDFDMGNYLLKDFYLRKLCDFASDAVKYLFPEGKALKKYKDIISEIRDLEGKRNDCAHAIWEKSVKDGTPLRTRLQRNEFGIITPHEVPINDEMIKEMRKDLRRMKKLDTDLAFVLLRTGFKFSLVKDPPAM